MIFRSLLIFLFTVSLALSGSACVATSGTVSGGLYEPGDVWAPIADDLFYDEAALSARIGTEVGLAAATAGFSLWAQSAGRFVALARALNIMDLASNGVGLSRSLYGIYCNDLDWANGLMSVAQGLGVLGRSRGVQGTELFTSVSKNG